MLGERTGLPYLDGSMRKSGREPRRMGASLEQKAGAGPSGVVSAEVAMHVAGLSARHNPYYPYYPRALTKHFRFCRISMIGIVNPMAAHTAYSLRVYRTSRTKLSF